MQDLPHLYTVAAAAGPSGDVDVSSEGVETIVSGPPSEFGGAGGQWSPETLLVAAVADCFILSFRAIARASKLSWNALNCEVDGKLERSDGVLRFTEFAVRATLIVPEETTDERAMRIMEKADKSCLITNSLISTTRLEAIVSRDG